MSEEIKYDFELDMKSDNSNSVILRNINPNSKILEIGCAHGRMTKYLKENLNCNITISEINELSGKTARNWADKYFIGLYGNVESPHFFTQLELNEVINLDYIIFADVLEHLHNPEKVLFESKRLLNKDGSIWISIPNISHNAVLIDLWNDEFKYRPIGLLDNTHIKFFTERSLYQMIDEAGFKINKKFNLQNTVENTEFKNSYDDLPIDVGISMRSRRNAETYQFVWELKIK